MNILLAKTAGFCFGVKRAIDCVYSKAGQGTICTYGPIIHNKEVIKDLESKGVYAIDSLEGMAAGAHVIIRSHGVPPSVYEELKGKNIQYTDCTCPFVKKIHDIVQDAGQQGHSVIIVGDPCHPEVLGILGWAPEDTVVLLAPEDAESQDYQNVSYDIVVQTTFQYSILEQILGILEKKRIQYRLFNTICSATVNRQNEAREIAEQADVMFVVGDKGSSNTQKLYKICKEICEKTYYIETIHDLRLNNCKTDDKIGITAGASTPSAIIKEVFDKMSEFDNRENEIETNEFAQMLDESFVTLHNGQVVKGTVIQISEDGSVSVNLGYKMDGVIEKDEFSNDPDKKPADLLQLGDEIEVYVLHVNDREGTVSLSAKRIEAFKGMEKLETAFEEKTPVTGLVTEIIKGGAIAVTNGARVFIPASQMSNRYVEDLNVFKGQEIEFEILELDRSKRRVIGGRKELQKKEIEKKKEEIFSSLTEGEKRKGTVSRLTDFGAFVDIGGLDGLIHISELSWGRVKHPSEVLKEGDEVEVIILGFDKEKGKISLSLKDITQDPWVHAAENYHIGDIVTGRVVRMVPFGAFVELEQGIDGLVHISQIANKHVAKVEDVLSLGEVVQVKILDVNLEKKQISLSKKEADGVSADDEAQPGETAEPQAAEEAVQQDVQAEEIEEAAGTAGEAETTEE